MPIDLLYMMYAYGNAFWSASYRLKEGIAILSTGSLCCSFSNTETEYLQCTIVHKDALIRDILRLIKDRNLHINEG